jgi:hypothetical protein
MVTRPVVHLDDESHTLRTRFDVVVRVGRFTIRRGERSDLELILHASKITRGVGMPQLSTVVTKLVTTTRTLALQLRTAGAPRRYDRVAAVRRRAPPDIGDADEGPPQGELLVLGEQVIVIENHLNVARVAYLGALRTRHHDTALTQRDDQILFETVDAVPVFAVYE